MFGSRLFFLFLFFFQWGIAQKLVEKAVHNPKTKYVRIDVTKCYRLVLDTHTSDFLKIEATMEGEYAKDLVIKLEENGDNITISADFLPSFDIPNDKLSAHKVISIEMHVTLPESMTTSVHGTHTNVTAKGTYKHLSVTLADGNCTLDNISEKAEVKTQTGEIVLKGARGTVTTKNIYGKVEKGPVPQGNQIYSLQTVEGSIIVNKNNG